MTTLVLGPGFQLAAILLEPDTDSTVDALGWIADHPDRSDLAQVLFLLAMPFMLGAALVYVLLSRRRSPRLAYAGGILLGFGFVGLSAVAGYETLAIALAQDGRFDSTALAEVLAEMSSPPAIAMLLIFIPFTFVGVLTSAAALWRSSAVPRGAALLIATFILVDLFLNEGLGLVPSSAAHAIGFVAACWIASSVVAAGRALGVK